MPSVKSAPTIEQVNRVRGLRIIFAHQSVGSNILDGVRSAAGALGESLTMVESRDPLLGPGIQHFKVGQNEDPLGKLSDFSAVLSRRVTEPADIAMLKFCYLDFTKEIDPKQLATEYIATLNRLQKLYPRTTFVPMTSPLTTAQTGVRAWLKRALGKHPAGYSENFRRHRFNQILREHYAQANVLFDIADLESGNREKGIGYQGQRIETLDPMLSDDGGHLNADGRRLIGAALISHLATLSRS